MDRVGELGLRALVLSSVLGTVVTARAADPPTGHLPAIRWKQARRAAGRIVQDPGHAVEHVPWGRRRIVLMGETHVKDQPTADACTEMLAAFPVRAIESLALHRYSWFARLAARGGKLASEGRRRVAMRLRRGRTEPQTPDVALEQTLAEHLKAAPTAQDGARSFAAMLARGYHLDELEPHDRLGAIGLLTERCERLARGARQEVNGKARGGRGPLARYSQQELAPIVATVSEYLESYTPQREAGTIYSATAVESLEWNHQPTRAENLALVAMGLQQAAPVGAAIYTGIAALATWPLWPAAFLGAAWATAHLGNRIGAYRLSAGKRGKLTALMHPVSALLERDTDMARNLQALMGTHPDLEAVLAIEGLAHLPTTIQNLESLKKGSH